MDEMTSRRDYAAHLQAALDAALATPGIDGLAALRQALEGDGRRPGFRAALDVAVAQRIDAELTAGALRGDLARALGVRPTRVSQIRATVAGPQKPRRGLTPEQRAAEERERARANRARRRAEAARLGEPYLERVDAGEGVRAIAAAEGLSWQRLSALVRAARAARDAEPTT